MGHHMKLRKLAVMIWLVVFLRGFLCNSVSGQEDQMYMKALSLINEKQYADGIKTYYKYLLKYDPVSSIDSRRNDIAPAIDYVENEARKEISDSVYKLLKAIISRILHQIPEAQDILDGIRKNHPNSPFLEFLKGEFHLSNDQTEEAVLAFMKLKTMPRASGLSSIAEIIMKRHGIDSDAVARKAALLRRAFRHIDLFEREQGEIILRQTIREFPGDVEASSALIDLLIEMERLDDAQKVMDDLKETSSPASVRHSQEARLRFYQGKYQEVPEILAPVEDNLDELCVFILAESYFQLGQFVDAMPLYKKLLDSDPLNTGFLLRETACIEAMGNIASAAELLEMRTEAQDDSSALIMERAALLERLNRQDEAMREYRKVAASPGPLQDEAKVRIEIIMQWITECKQNESSISTDLHKIHQKNPDSMSSADEFLRKSSYERIAIQQAVTEKRLKRLYE